MARGQSDAAVAAPEGEAAPKKPKKKRKPTKRGNRPNRQSVHESKKEIERMENIKTALAFRRQGLGYGTIAELMERPLSTVYSWVKAGIRMIPEEEAADVRAMELDRLDNMQQHLYGQFEEEPNPLLIDGILKIMDRRAKYLGLYKSEDTQARAFESMADSLKAAIGADVPILKPDGAVPASPIL